MDTMIVPLHEDKSSEDATAYLDEHVHPLLSQGLVEVAKAKPEDPIVCFTSSVLVIFHVIPFTFSVVFVWFRGGLVNG
jgi:hypothetical protein